MTKTPPMTDQLTQDVVLLVVLTDQARAAISEIHRIIGSVYPDADDAKRQQMWATCKATMFKDVLARQQARALPAPVTPLDLYGARRNRPAHSRRHATRN